VRDLAPLDDTSCLNPRKANLDLEIPAAPSQVTSQRIREAAPLHVLENALTVSLSSFDPATMCSCTRRPCFMQSLSCFRSFRFPGQGSAIFYRQLGFCALPALGFLFWIGHYDNLAMGFIRVSVARSVLSIRVSVARLASWAGSLQY
jgi:hypothetical protein